MRRKMKIFKREFLYLMKHFNKENLIAFFKNSNNWINWNMVGLVVSAILVLGMIGMGSPRGLAGMLLFIGCYLFLFVFDFVVFGILETDTFFPYLIILGFNIYIIALSFLSLSCC
jgi:hypothetical protein